MFFYQTRDSFGEDGELIEASGEGVPVPGGWALNCKMVELPERSFGVAPKFGAPRGERESFPKREAGLCTEGHGARV